jgi:hypothetical protein
VYKPGHAQDAEVVRDCGLALAERLDEVAHAYLAFRGSGEHGQDPEPDRVGEGGKALSKLIGVSLLVHVGARLACALWRMTADLAELAGVAVSFDFVLCWPSRAC